MSLNTGNAILSNGITLDSSYNVGIGGAATAGISLKNTKKLTGASTTFANYADGQIQTDATGLSHYFYSEANVIAATTATGIYHFKATQGTFGAGSSLTVQAGLVIDNSLSGAATNYGIISNINAADSNWNLYIGGSAKNWIASSLGIGAGLSTPTATLDVNGTLKASGAATFSSSVTAASSITSTSGDLYATDGTRTNYLGVSTGSNIGIIGMTSNHNLTFITNNTERMRITSGGNVGIGTSSPANKLQVNSTSGDGMFLTSYLTTTGAADTGAILGFGIYDGVNNRDAAIIKGLKENGTSGNYSAYLSFSTRPNGGSVTERMRINSIGNIIFTSQVYGNTVGTPRTLYIQSDGEIGGVSTSLRESKINIESFDTNWLYKLNPVSFNYRKKNQEGDYTEDYHDELYYGLIAEEAELINKELCTYTNDKLAGIEYSKLVPVLLKAVQEQQAQIEAQQQQINSLINR